jgi:hypothetical protein
MVWGGITAFGFEKITIVVDNMPLKQYVHCQIIYTSGKKKLCITKKSIKDQYQNKIY